VLVSRGNDWTRPSTRRLRCRHPTACTAPDTRTEDSNPSPTWSTLPLTRSRLGGEWGSTQSLVGPARRNGDAGDRRLRRRAVCRDAAATGVPRRSSPYGRRRPPVGVAGCVRPDETAVTFRPRWGRRGKTVLLFLNFLVLCHFARFRRGSTVCIVFFSNAQYVTFSSRVTALREKKNKKLQFQSIRKTICLLLLLSHASRLVSRIHTLIRTREMYLVIPGH
jgi:hypothetical protein